jgi:pimeloyl-ACP methyl ester carboxylesterase
MTATQTGSLEVPGATLHYETRGSGPLLLVLYGMAGAGSGRLAEELCAHYTVATFDRRGTGRSTVHDSAAPLRLETDSDDAHRLLAALSEEPALVFGASNGALLALDLALRHPEQVRRVVAHEPPAPRLLPEPERAVAERAQAEVEEAYRCEGPLAAMRRLAALAGFEPRNEGSAGLTAGLAGRDAFFTRIAPATHRYVPDLDALRATSAHIVAAAGATSGGSFPARCARALAELVGRPLATFPGNHAGFVAEPKAFARTLQHVLDRAPGGGPAPRLDLLPGPIRLGDA